MVLSAMFGELAIFDVEGMKKDVKKVELACRKQKHQPLGIQLGPQLMLPQQLFDPKGQ